MVKAFRIPRKKVHAFKVVKLNNYSVTVTCQTCIHDHKMNWKDRDLSEIKTEDMNHNEVSAYNVFMFY